MDTSAYLQGEFEKAFGRRPTHLVWSPGRLNLIGEHTDYNMLPVLPIAIDRGLTMAIARNESHLVRCANLDQRFERSEFRIGAEIPAECAGHWSNYLRASAQHAYQRAVQNSLLCHGYDTLVSSTLPAAAGLSSSSALVVSGYLALDAVNGWCLPNHRVAQLAADAEHYVGTAGGGMDQATILLGKEDHALMIDFDPLRIQPVPIPQSAVFFAIDSLTRAEKSGTARLSYNRRVLECRVGLELMRRHAQDHQLHELAGEWRSLRDVLESFPHTWRDLHDNAMRQQPYSLTSVSLGLGDERLSGILRTTQLTRDAAASLEPFPVFQRVRHVLSEAERVRRCAHALDAGDLEAAAEQMNASHASCRDDYGISTPQIERLVEAARAAGALAARITGAGFGGSIVAMVREADADRFRRNLWADYFKPQNAAPEEKVILRCSPARGAEVIAGG